LTKFLVSKNPSYNIVIEPELPFHPSKLTHPNALEFGCEPDYNAWLGAEMRNPRIDPKSVGNYRFAGGHIHFGFDTSKCEIPVPYLVQMLDALVLTKHFAADHRVIGRTRCEFYGKPGSYRYTKYGFEYRTPSNRWLLKSNLFVDIVSTLHWLINRPDDAYPIYKRIESIQQTVRNFLGGWNNAGGSYAIIDSELGSDMSRIRDDLADEREKARPVPLTPRQQVLSPRPQAQPARQVRLRELPTGTLTVAPNGANAQDSIRGLEVLRAEIRGHMDGIPVIGEGGEALEIRATARQVRPYAPGRAEFIRWEDIAPPLESDPN
jgi:hypothetical protein